MGSELMTYWVAERLDCTYRSVGEWEARTVARSGVRINSYLTAHSLSIYAMLCYLRYNLQYTRTNECGDSPGTALEEAPHRMTSSYPLALEYLSISLWRPELMRLSSLELL